MIKTIIFDFNGTMIFDSQLQHQAWEMTLSKEFKHRMTEEEFQNQICGRNNKYTFNYFADHKLKDSTVDNYSQAKEIIYRKICLSRPESFKLVKGLPDFLDHCIENNININIATASEMYNVEFFFKHLHLEKWFDINKVVANDGTLPGKPEPDMFLQAIKNVDGEPNTTMIFEDSLTGLKGAHNAKVAETIMVNDPDEPNIALPSELIIARRIQNFENMYTVVV
ncbi:HAD family hydrolase [Companilactobacillus ginsenosidimutans]|uniref:Beta-phosphoglucomutase n=1 Tax=Companilactobacillus ginsenosidimutans TaxID=1007676 RepID=A0A0H4QJK3_9LACO|nr:HAD family phosphatase [Companilactobacillus ginsenosidimutans]AKP67221.1 beta-phosphoglucomutase [Companilactobacillus ginsenosidimutans]